MQCFAPDSNSRMKMLAHALRNKEGFVFGPSICRLGQANFLFAHWGAVSAVGIGLVRRTKSYHAANNDQRWPIIGFLKYFDCPAQAIQVIYIIHFDNIPAVSAKPFGHILAESQRGMAFT